MPCPYRVYMNQQLLQERFLSPLGMTKLDCVFGKPLRLSQHEAPGDHVVQCLFLLREPRNHIANKQES